MRKHSFGNHLVSVRGQMLSISLPFCFGYKAVYRPDHRHVEASKVLPLVSAPRKQHQNMSIQHFLNNAAYVVIRVTDKSVRIASVIVTARRKNNNLDAIGHGRIEFAEFVCCGLTVGSLILHDDIVACCSQQPFELCGVRLIRRDAFPECVASTKCDYLDRFSVSDAYDQGEKEH